MVLLEKTRLLVKKVHNAIQYRENSDDDMLPSPVGSFENEKLDSDFDDSKQQLHFNCIDINTPPLTPTTHTVASYTLGNTSLTSLPPLVSSQIVDDNFPVQDYTKWESVHGLSGCQDCLVCTRPFGKGDQIRELPCNSTTPHIFHSSCLFDWLTQSNLSCPTCDTQVLTQE